MTQSDFTNPFGNAGIGSTPVDPTGPGGSLIAPSELTPSGALDDALLGDGAGGWVVKQLPPGGLPVVDTTSLVKDPVDATKLVRIDAGSVSAGTTRTISMPDKDVVLDDVADSRTPTGAAGGKLTGTFPNPGAVAATEAVSGIVELADSTETTAGLALQASDTRLPTQPENDALVGTSGAPSTANKYVTNDDPRFSFPTDIRVKRAKAGEDWAVAVEADSVDDSVSGVPGMVFLFDDTIEEGVGFEAARRVPVGSTQVTIELLIAADSAPPAIRSVAFKLYTKAYGDDAVRAALGLGWSAGVVMADGSILTSQNWQYYSQTITMATLGLTAGDWVRFEVTRIAPAAGVNLVGDLAVKEETFVLRFH